MKHLTFKVEQSNNILLNSISIQNADREFSEDELVELLRDASRTVPKGYADYCNLICKSRGASKKFNFMVRSSQIENWINDINYQIGKASMLFPYRENKSQRLNESLSVLI